MDPEDDFRAASLELFKNERANIDRVFLPYLDRINALPFVVSSQCCAGHVLYTITGKTGSKPISRKLRPHNGTGRWGYLHIAVTLEASRWLHERARLDGWDSWIWVHNSQLFAEGARQPCAANDHWGMLGFAWDAKHWPQPAEDITEALEQLVPKLGTRYKPSALSVAPLI